IVLTGAMLFLPGLKKRGRGGYVSYLPAPSTAVAAETSSWTQAVQKIKEDRGEPTGKQAKVEIPQQLRHYSDTRRFLAVQVAEWREHRFETPHDFVDLARMLKSGEMVELPQVSRNYILFGVGGNADLAPFTRYENGKRIPLYKETELARAYASAAQTRAVLENEIASLKAELSALSKTERSKRAKLQAQINEKEKAGKFKQEEKEALDRYYEAAEKRQQLFTDYASLESLAESFTDRTYNIEDARSRQAMKVRMLSSLRPEALKVMEEVASAYRQKFDRPLPITSLVRPDEYQHALSKVNPNATRIETPPHSTGLAFDVYYRFMTAEEQAFVMDYLARLKDEGRIEVLRELRDHYHVFAFVDGKRPDESVVRATLSKTKETKDAQHAE
ncbi:MAG TPA: DUF5715 family protein, partial [Pyrinomonadaceae bacterium]